MDTSEKSENSGDLPIVFNGDVIAHADSYTFMGHSVRYKLNHRSITGPLVIETPVDPASLAEFIHGCEGKEMKITSSNVCDLFALCTEWDTPKLMDQVMTFIDTSEGILPRVIANLSTRGINVTTLEDKLHDNFVSLCNEDSYKDLMSVGVPILARIFEKNENELVSEHLHDVFGFILFCLKPENLGNVASVFLSGVNFSALTTQERQSLLAERTADFSFMNGSQMESDVEHESSIAKYRVLQETLLNELNAMKDENRAFQQKMLQEFSSFRAEMLALIGAPRTEQISLVSIEGESQSETRPRSSKGSRLTLSDEEKRSPSKRSPKYTAKSCPFDNDPFCGIFHFLSTFHGGNPEQKGLVVVTASQCVRGEPGKLLDTAGTLFETVPASGDEFPWVLFEFKEMRVHVSHYSMASGAGCFYNGPTPTQWKLEGSNDKVKWTTLDNRTGDLARFPVKTYSCNRVDDEKWTMTYFTFIRLKMIKNDSREKEDQKRLFLRNFELFGRVTDKE